MLKLEEVRPAIGQLVTHGILLTQLARVEWAAEKRRLARMFALSVLAAVMSVVLLFSVSFIVMLLAWDTPYRWAAALALVVLYAIGLLFAIRKLSRLASLTDHAFIGTREELAADFALLKRKLLP